MQDTLEGQRRTAEAQAVDTAAARLLELPAEYVEALERSADANAADRGARAAAAALPEGSPARAEAEATAARARERLADLVHVPARLSRTFAANLAPVEDAAARWGIEAETLGTSLDCLRAADPRREAWYADVRRVHWRATVELQRPWCPRLAAATLPDTIVSLLEARKQERLAAETLGWANDHVRRARRDPDLGGNLGDAVPSVAEAREELAMRREALAICGAAYGLALGMVLEVVRDHGLDPEPFGWTVEDLEADPARVEAVADVCRRAVGRLLVAGSGPEVPAPTVEREAAADPTAPAAGAGSGMAPGPDFETFRWGVKTFDFPRPMQRRCIRALWEAYEDGRRPLSVETLRDRVGARESAKPSDWFRGHPAWKRLVVTPTQGRYALQPPETPKL